MDEEVRTVRGWGEGDVLGEGAQGVVRRVVPTDALDEVVRRDVAAASPGTTFVAKRFHDLGDLRARSELDLAVLLGTHSDGWAPRHIVRVFDHGPGWIVMEEALESRSWWAQVCRTAPPQSLPLRLLRFALDVVRGLDELTSAPAGILAHRDLKPSNVLVTPDGAAKLADLGLAYRQRANVTELAHAGRTDVVVGSRGYLPPEALGASSAFWPSVTPQAALAHELWALGAVLWSLWHDAANPLADHPGDVPFHRPGDPSSVTTERAGDPIVRAAAVEQLPRPLAVLCAALFAPDPRERPDLATTEELLRRLVDPAGGGAGRVRPIHPERLIAEELRAHDLLAQAVWTTCGPVSPAAYEERAAALVAALDPDATALVVPLESGELDRLAASTLGEHPDPFTAVLSESTLRSLEERSSGSPPRVRWARPRRRRRVPRALVATVVLLGVLGVGGWTAWERADLVLPALAVADEGPDESSIVSATALELLSVEETSSAVPRSITGTFDSAFTPSGRSLAPWAEVTFRFPDRALPRGEAFAADAGACSSVGEPASCRRMAAPAGTVGTWVQPVALVQRGGQVRVVSETPAHYEFDGARLRRGPRSASPASVLQSTRRDTGSGRQVWHHVLEAPLVEPGRHVFEFVYRDPDGQSVAVAFVLEVTSPPSAVIGPVTSFQSHSVPGRQVPFAAGFEVTNPLPTDALLRWATSPVVDDRPWPTTPEGPESGVVLVPARSVATVVLEGFPEEYSDRLRLRVSMETVDGMVLGETLRWGP